MKKTRRIITKVVAKTAGNRSISPANGDSATIDTTPSSASVAVSTSTLSSHSQPQSISKPSSLSSSPTSRRCCAASPITVIALVLSLTAVLGLFTFSYQMNTTQQAAFTTAMYSLSNLELGKAINELGAATSSTISEEEVADEKRVGKGGVEEEEDAAPASKKGIVATLGKIAGGKKGLRNGRPPQENDFSSAGNDAQNDAAKRKKKKKRGFFSGLFGINPKDGAEDDGGDSVTLRLGSSKSEMERLRQQSRDYDGDAFREDFVVKKKWDEWASSGNKTAESVWKGRTFYDETPNTFPLNVTYYKYLREYEYDMLPLYPKYLKDYKHAYGNCKGSHRYNTAYSNEVVVSDKDNTDTFSRLWPNIPDRRMKFPTEHERCHAVMIRQLAILTSVLEHYNLTNWFISHATLLGAVRHGGMIPWDVDVDVVMTRTTSKFLRKIWRREFPRDMFLQTERTDPGFHLWIGTDRGARIKDRYSGFHGFEFTHTSGKNRKKRKISRYQNGAGVDIIPINRVPVKGGSRDRMKVFHSYFNASDVFPTSKICFENIEVRAPKDPEWFLDLIYGKDKWRELPDHPILAAPTALPCVSTTPLWGSVWNLKWEKDHPMVGHNKTIIDGDYIPYTASVAEDMEARKKLEAEEKLRTTTLAALDDAKSNKGQKRFQSKVTPPPTTTAAKAAESAAEDGDVEQSSEKASADEKNSNGEKADNGKPKAVYPVVGAKLFPRADPHGTHREDFARPYMKYHQHGQPKYMQVQNKDERA